MASSAPPFTRPRRGRRSRGSVVAGGLLALAVATAPGRSATAYGRVVNAAGQPYHWYESCVFMTPSATLTMPAGDMPPDLVLAVEWASATAWSRGAVPCSYMDVQLNPPGAAALHVAPDGINSIIVRSDSWSRLDGDRDPGRALDPRALALTSFFAPMDGDRIYDADIELNAVNFSFRDVDPESSDPDALHHADLQNTLTHEMGHVLGLEHNCAPDAPLMAVGADGQPVPSCTGLDPAAFAKIQEATMYFQTDSGEISKRTLADDDIAAICASYPRAQDPQSCVAAKLPQGTSCSARIGGERAACDRPGLGAAILGLALALRRGARRGAGHGDADRPTKKERRS